MSGGLACVGGGDLLLGAPGWGRSPLLGRHVAGSLVKQGVGEPRGGLGSRVPARDAAPGFAVDDDACQGDHNCQEHQNHHHDDREAPGCCGTHGPTSGHDLRQGPGRFPETQPFSAPIGRALWTPQGGPSTLHRDSQLSSDGLESLAGWPWATVLWAQLCL